MNEGINGPAGRFWAEKNAREAEASEDSAAARAVVEQTLRPNGTGAMVYGVRVTEGALKVGDVVRGPDGDLAQITEIRNEQAFPNGTRAALHLSPTIALRDEDEITRD